MNGDTYPICNKLELKEGFIVSCPYLKMEVDYFNNPQSIAEIWYNNYFTLACFLLNSSREDFEQRIVNGIARLKNHPNYHEAIFSTKLCLILNKYMVAGQIADFSIVDIFVPDKKRLLVIWSGVLNFLRLCQMHNVRIQPILNIKKQLEDLKFKLIEEVSNLDEKNTELSFSMKENQAILKKKHHEESNLSKKLKFVLDSFNSLTIEIKPIDGKLQNFEQRKNELNKDIKDVNSKIKSVLPLIVRSPMKKIFLLDDMKLEILDLEKKHTKAINLTSELNSKIMDMKKTISNFKAQKPVIPKFSYFEGLIEDNSNSKEQRRYESIELRQKLENLNNVQIKNQRRLLEKKKTNQKTEKYYVDKRYLYKNNLGNLLYGKKEKEEILEIINFEKKKFDEQIMNITLDVNQQIDIYIDKYNYTEYHIEQLANSVNLHMIDVQNYLKDLRKI